MQTESNKGIFVVVVVVRLFLAGYVSRSSTSTPAHRHGKYLVLCSVRFRFVRTHALLLCAVCCTYEHNVFLSFEVKVVYEGDSFHACSAVLNVCADDDNERVYTHTVFVDRVCVCVPCVPGQGYGIFFLSVSLLFLYFSIFFSLLLTWNRIAVTCCTHTQTQAHIRCIERVSGALSSNTILLLLVVFVRKISVFFCVHASEVNVCIMRYFVSCTHTAQPNTHSTFVYGLSIAKESPFVEPGTYKIPKAEYNFSSFSLWYITVDSVATTNPELVLRFEHFRN